MGLAFSQETQRWVIALRRLVADRRAADIRAAIEQVQRDSEAMDGPGQPGYLTRGIVEALQRALEEAERK